MKSLAVSLAVTARWELFVKFTEQVSIDVNPRVRELVDPLSDRLSPLEDQIELSIGEGV